MSTNVPPRRRAVPLVVAGTLLAASAVLATALPASAHVTVRSNTTTPGDYGQLTFSVPTESDSESTARIEIALPEDTPFTSVRTVPVAGWSAELVREELDEPVDDGHGGTITEAVTRVVWTADDAAAAIGQDETGLFTLSVGPLPHDVDELFFPTLQVYDSGREVFWSQEATGDAEPDHPAPSIELSEQAEHDDATSDETTGDPEVNETDPVLAAAFVIGTTGVVLGIAGLGVAVAALRRARAASQ